MIDLRNYNCLHTKECQQCFGSVWDDLTWYGIDWYAPSPSDDGLSTVLVEAVGTLLRDYSFSMYAKFSKKLIFLTPWYAQSNDQAIDILKI